MCSSDLTLAPIQFRAGGPKEQILARRGSKDEKQAFINKALANGDAGIDTSGDGLIDTVVLDTVGDGQADTLRPLDFHPSFRSSAVRGSL